jgi:peptidyl-prolyl cis-trans isomerase SurA
MPLRRAVSGLCLSLSLAASGGGTLLAQEGGRPLPQRGPGGIVAVVNQDVITRRELDRRVTVQMEEVSRREAVPLTALERQRPQLERAVLDFLVEQRLLLQDAKKNNIATSDAEVDAEINHRIEKDFRGMVRDADELYKILKENYGYSREEYREQVREDILINRLLWTKYFHEPFATPGEMREYYRSHPEEFETPSELTFRMITVENSEEAPHSLEEIDGALDQRPFAEVSKQFAAVNRKEDLLWRKSLTDLKEWKPPLPEVLSRMKAGEVQRRIRTVDGWRYVEMVEVKPGKRKSFEEAQAQIEKAIRSECHFREKALLTERLKKEAHLEDSLGPLPPPLARPAAFQKKPEEPASKVRDASPDAGRPKKDAGPKEKDGQKGKDSKGKDTEE